MVNCPMEKQTFVVTLKILPPFEQYFPKMEAERMANIIRGVGEFELAEETSGGLVKVLEKT